MPLDLFADEPPAAKRAPLDLFADEKPPAASPQAPKPNYMGAGAQGILRSVADIIGTPVDLISGGMNAVTAIPRALGIKVPPVKEPFLGSDSIAKSAATLGDLVGIRAQPPEAMSGKDKLAYNVSRFGTGAMLGGAGAASAAARMSGPTSKVGSVIKAMAAPYADAPARIAAAPSRLAALGESLRPLATDAASGVGAGTALSVAEDYAPNSPITQGLATLFGAAIGPTAINAVTAPGRMATRFKNAIELDPSVPEDNLGFGTTRSVAQKAGEIAKNMALDPKAAAEQIRNDTAMYRDLGVSDSNMPTSGLLSNDPALIANEHSGRSDITRLKNGENTSPLASLFVNRDDNVLRAVRGFVGDLGSPNADMELPRLTAEQRLKNVAARAEAPVEAAKQGIRDAAAQEQQLGAQIALPKVPEGQASANLDKAVVDEGLKPLQTQRSALYNDAVAKGANIEIPAEKVDALLRQLKGEGKIFSDKKAAEDFVAQIAPKLKYSEDGELLGYAGDPITFKDLQDIRPAVSEAISSASGASPNIPRRKGFQEIQKFINDTASEAAASSGNPEAAAALDKALKFDSETFLPAWGRGEAQRFRSDLNADMDYQKPRPDGMRSDTPASATGARFLKSGPDGAKELSTDLRRIIDVSPSKGAAIQAARDIVAARMASVVAEDGTVNLTRMRKFMKDYQDSLAPFPEIQKEVQTTLTNAVNRRQASTLLEDQLLSAQKKQKAAKGAMDKSALSLMLGKEPKKAIASVFSAPHPEKAMRELARTVKRDPQAVEGLKEAIKTHLDASIMGGSHDLSGDNVVALGRLEGVSGKYVGTFKALVEEGIYTPKQMNQLQTGRRLLIDLQKKGLKATAGSNTVSDMQYKVPPLLDALFRVQYGALKGGSKVRSGNVVLKVLSPVISSLPGMTDQIKAQYLVQKAWFDPELMAHLLEMPSPQQTPVWNKAVRQLLGLQAAAREAVDPNETKPKKIPRIEINPKEAK